jgi:hypothetical protein
MPRYKMRFEATADLCGFFNVCAAKAIPLHDFESDRMEVIAFDADLTLNELKEFVGSVTDGHVMAKWPTSTPESEPPSDSQQSKEAFLLECLIDVTEQVAPLREELAEHRQRLSDLEQIALHLAEVTR